RRPRTPPPRTRPARATARAQANEAWRSSVEGPPEMIGRGAWPRAPPRCGKGRRRGLRWSGWVGAPNARDGRHARPGPSTVPYKSTPGDQHKRRTADPADPKPMMSVALEI